MRVLIACEFSGAVRRAFELMGHEVVSCDLLPSLDYAVNHRAMDIFKLLEQDSAFDMMIAFPPCTHLCASGARWFKDKHNEQENAIRFVRKLMQVDIDRIAIENPIGVLSTRVAKPNQIIQPWHFGHPEAKSTCLWLKGLPLLRATHTQREGTSAIHAMGASKARGYKRSITYDGIAFAMALQWGRKRYADKVERFNWMPQVPLGLI